MYGTFSSHQWRAGITRGGGEEGGKLRRKGERGGNDQQGVEDYPGGKNTRILTVRRS